MTTPIRVATIRLSDVDDVAVYAGFAISEWEKTELAQGLKKYNVYPTLWRSRADPNSFGISIDLICEEYAPEDLALAQLAGFVGQEIGVTVHT